MDSTTHHVGLITVAAYNRNFYILRFLIHYVKYISNLIEQVKINSKACEGSCTNYYIDNHVMVAWSLQGLAVGLYKNLEFL